MRSFITIHKKEDFKPMREAGRAAADCLDAVTDMVVPGVSTADINDFCHKFILEKGGTPAPLGYRGFPAATCTSVNHVVCHGIPSHKKILKEGDICNVDVTVLLNGWHGDTSRTFIVGEKVGLRMKLLVETTYKALTEAILAVSPEGHFGDIGAAVEKVAKEKRYSIVRDFCGHGIGKFFHSAPNVLHVGKKGEGEEIKAGMFFTIEPMINLGTYEVKTLEDQWTAVTRDGKLSAQFEHTIGVHEAGIEIFTLGRQERLSGPLSQLWKNP